MNLLDRILSVQNFNEAIKEVAQNKGAPGIDGMTVDELQGYFAVHGDEIRTQIRYKQYRPQPVRRVYIPKPNSDKLRPLGIPTVVDRVIQQAVSRILILEYDPYFSDHSYGFRPRRDGHQAMKEALGYLNEGRTWVVDFDIEKYFDTVNHDKLISILRERMNDATVLHLIRSFLKAGVMDDGLVSPTEEGVPQGGPLSCGREDPFPASCPMSILTNWIRNWNQGDCALSGTLTIPKLKLCRRILQETVHIKNPN